LEGFPLAKTDYSLNPQEEIFITMEFLEGGFLGFLLKILGPLLQQKKTLGAVITNQRITNPPYSRPR
jgi:hypothetical protein